MFSPKAVVIQVYTVQKLTPIDWCSLDCCVAETEAFINAPYNSMQTKRLLAFSNIQTQYIYKCSRFGYTAITPSKDVYE